jgi:hypothetical protein
MVLISPQVLRTHARFAELNVDLFS